MYVRTSPGATEWVLFLEGGGWCFGSTPDATLASCAGRARGGGGSSAHNPPTAPDYGGVMSANSTLNPRFHSWNQVFMKYCDGSSFGGLNAAPVPHSPKPVHFRGRACFDALVQDLQKSYGLSKATEVILSGGSAGGLAVFYNVDHLADLLGSKVMLTGFPDAGVSPPSPPNSPVPDCRQCPGCCSSSSTQRLRAATSGTESSSRARILCGMSPAREARMRPASRPRPRTSSGSASWLARLSPLALARLGRV